MDDIFGLNMLDVLLYVPLNPKKRLLLADRSEIAIERSDIVTDIRTVQRFNHQQVKSAEQWVFSKTADFSAAVNLLAMRPELRRRHRDRVIEKNGTLQFRS